MPSIKSIDSLLNEALIDDQKKVIAFRRAVEDFIKNINPTITEIDKQNLIVSYEPDNKTDIIFALDKGSMMVNSISIYSPEIQDEVDGVEDVKNILDSGNLYDALHAKLRKMFASN